jgi:thiamine biosynthesis lipoprotein
MLKDAGMAADLGAIAKGAITDKVKEFLIKKGVTSAIINAGGNVLTIGTKPDGTPFSVGIQTPEDLRGAYLFALDISDRAVVSSGDYERYFEVDGVRYHHILDPFTGYPADTNISQVSIIADNGINADALSTTVLLLGVSNGLALIDSITDVEAVFVTKDKKIYITPALRPYITENTQELAGYTLVTDPDELNN